MPIFAAARTMELFSEWTEAGLPALFLACFLAATVLPFSSEALLAAMALGPWSTLALLATAAVGNTLGGLCSYAIGRWLPEGRWMRRLRADPAKGEQWKDRVQRYGPWAALGCWLPVVGDPLAVALGLFRVRFWPVLALMFIGKAARYAVVLAALRGWPGA